MTEQSTSENIPENQIGKAIAIASGKGGVGKSTVAVNISVALAKKGLKVGLLDADIYGPNVPTMMGISAMPPQDGPKLKPAEVHGVQVMSIGFLVPDGQPLIWRGPMLHSAIQQFINDVAWGQLDYLVVDLPPGTGDVQLSLAQTLPLSGGVIVTLPQKVSIEDAWRGLEMFRTMEIPLLGVVENMSFLELPDGTQLDIFGQGGGERMAQEASVPFLGTIPIDPAVREGGDQGAPIVISHPDTPAAAAFNGITEAILARFETGELKGTEDIEIEITD